MTDETLEQFPERDAILKAIDDLGKSLSERIDNLERMNNIQFEAIRRGIAENSARFDQLEAIALDAKSIALQTRSQLTILTEEVRQMKKEVIV